MARQAQPKVNIKKGLEDVREQHIASLSVLHESGQKLHAGFSELGKAYNDHMAEMFEHTMEAMKDICSAKSPQDAMNLHKNWVQESMKATLEQNNKLSKQAVEVIKNASKPAQEFAKQSVKSMKKS